MLRTRVLTAVVLVIVFLLALVWLPPPAWAAFATALVLPAAWEWGRLSRFEPGMVWGFVLAIAASCAALGVLALGADTSAWGGVTRIAYAAAAAFWIVCVPLCLWRMRLPQARFAAAVIGFLVLVPTWMAMIDLRAKGAGLLFLVMAVAWISDIAAYFAGRRFGRRKLAPAISPGKSWEGVAGALGAIALFGLVWANVWPQFAPALIAQDAWGSAYLLALLWFLTAAGIYGDLFESALKRKAGMKDSSNLLPGHGGVLDRIDALTAILPLAALVYSL